MKDHRPDYSKDPDFEGYLYLYDSDIIEEELQFEELLKNEVVAVESETAEDKRKKAIEFLKYAEEKFKTEKKEKSMFGIIKEKNKNFKDSLTSMVKNLIPGAEETMGDKPEQPSQFTTHEHHQTKPHLARADSRVLDPIPEAFKRQAGRPSQNLANGPQVIFSNQKKPGNLNYAKEDLAPSLNKKRQKERRLSVNFTDDLYSTEAKVNFFRREIFDKKFRNLSSRIKKLLKYHYDELIAKRSRYREKLQRKADLGKNIRKGKSKVRGFGPWDLLWEYKAEHIKRESPYNEFPSYRLRQVIVKGGDDLRQEIIAMQLIKKLQQIFKQEGASLVLKTYEIVVINSSSGIIGSLHSRRIYPRLDIDR
jgi:hypothetical protein